MNRDFRALLLTSCLFAAAGAATAGGMSVAALPVVSETGTRIWSGTCADGPTFARQYAATFSAATLDPAQLAAAYCASLDGALQVMLTHQWTVVGEGRIDVCFDATVSGTADDAAGQSTDQIWGPEIPGGAMLPVPYMSRCRALSFNDSSVRQYALTPGIDPATMTVYYDSVRTATCRVNALPQDSFSAADFLQANAFGVEGVRLLWPVSYDGMECTADPDGDGIDQSVDNCTEVANADQTDTDGDGFGNACDPDLNNDLVVNFIDLNAFKLAFLANPAAPAWNPHADYNGDGAINFLDLNTMKLFFLGPPGPSALAP